MLPNNKEFISLNAFSKVRKLLEEAGETDLIIKKFKEFLKN
jgi:hypothetical protein